MNKYRDESDFEINKAVAEELIQSGFIIGVTYHGNHISVTDKHANYYLFNPCNNPADAMPIIIENGIAIHPYKTATPAAFDAEIGEFHGHVVFNENIYRAAMEVFLMMKDAENETNT